MPIQVFQRGAVAVGDVSDPDLRVHDRVSMTHVREPEQVPNLVKRGAPLHVEGQRTTAVIVEGQGNTGGIDLVAVVSAPGFPDAVPWEVVDPLHDDIRHGGRLRSNESDGYPLRRPAAERSPDRVDHLRTPATTRVRVRDEHTDRLIGTPLPAGADGPRHGRYVCGRSRRLGGMRRCGDANERHAEVDRKEKGKRAAHGRMRTAFG